MLELDVAEVGRLSDLSDGVSVVGFDRLAPRHSVRTEYLRPLDTAVVAIGHAMLGLVDEKVGFLAEECDFAYSNFSPSANTLRSAISENSPGRLRGVFRGGVERPSFALVPRRFSGRLSNPRLTILINPTLDEIQAFTNTKESDGYAQETAKFIMASADVNVTGSNVVAATVDCFAIFPSANRSFVRMHRLLRDTRKKGYLDGLTAIRVIESGVDLNEDRRNDLWALLHAAS